VEIDSQKTTIYNFAPPILQFDTNSMEFKEYVLTINAADKTQTENNSKISTTLNFNIIADPLSNIELNSDNISPIYAIKGSYMVQNFQGSNISKGNSLRFKIDYQGTGNPSSFLTSDTSESTPYTVNFSGLGDQKGLILKSDSAAIIEISEEDEDGKKSEAFIFRCHNHSGSSEDCYQLTTIELTKGTLELVKSFKPRTILGTTVFFAYNPDLNVSYLFYISYENKKLNYEIFEGKLTDASFINTNGQIFGVYMIEKVGIVVSVFY
jgi:hypothetical protein